MITYIHFYKLLYRVWTLPNPIFSIYINTIYVDNTENTIDIR